jgi:hypothetical protein
MNMIEIRTPTGNVTLKVLEVAPANLPRAGDRKLSLEISSPKLQFRNHTFWLSESDWTRFLAASREVIAKRKGMAALQGMSPGCCQLVLEVKSPPKIELTVNVNQLSASRKAYPRTAAFLEDELDQEYLVQLDESLKD